MGSILLAAARTFDVVNVADALIVWARTVAEFENVPEIAATAKIKSVAICVKLISILIFLLLNSENEAQPQTKQYAQS